MRIWVTGIGVVSPLAVGAGATMDRLVRGDRGFGPLSLFEMPSSRCAIAAEVRDLPERAEARGSELSRTDRMALAAAREALGQAKLDPSTGALDLVVGGTTAGLFENEPWLAEMARSGASSPPGPEIRSYPLSATMDRMVQHVGPFRMARTLCSACSGGANALLLAATWLSSGRSERVLAGGADGLSRLTFAGFHCLGAMAPEACQPFDRNRKGLTLGEGAAFLVLETDRAARARGVEPLCELSGWAVGAERHHITNPEPSGETAARLMLEALRCAGLRPADIDYVNAHGTATPHNDQMEARALGLCFGAELERVRVSSSKGQMGHTLGAAGAIEAAICALSLGRAVAPPTRGLEEIDPACASLRHVLSTEPLAMRAAMSNSFGFGGTNTVLVFTQPGAFPPPPPRTPERVVVSAAATVGPLGLLGSQASAAYLEPGSGFDANLAGAIPFDDAALLDLERARRIDRPGRLTTALLETALTEARATPWSGQAALEAGLLVGSAYGPVDRSAAFLQRVFERGAKGAVPAAFPNLVPSSFVAHAAIYLGLGGPVLSLSDLAASSESAMCTAIELLENGEAALLAAGGVEERSDLADQVLGPLCAPTRLSLPRAEGGALVLFETEAAFERRSAAQGHGVRPLARVRWLHSWRGCGLDELGAAPPPLGPGRSVVVLSHESERARLLLEQSAWRDVPRHTSSGRAGRHEAAGGVAVAAAVGLLGRGLVDRVLSVGLAEERGFALLLTATEPCHQGGAE